MLNIITMVIALIDMLMPYLHEVETDKRLYNSKLIQVVLYVLHTSKEAWSCIVLNISSSKASGQICVRVSSMGCHGL